MAKIDKLKDEVKQGWQDSPVLSVCLSILDFLNALPNEEAEMLTFTSFKKAVGDEEVSEPLIRAVALLANTSIHALDTKLLFIDDEENEFPVEKAELAKARSKGVFIHPETGDPVLNFERMIVPRSEERRVGK